MNMRRYPPVTALSAAAQTGVVREIFTTVQDRYDFLNHFLSFRRDIGWRRAAISAMRFGRTNRMLDVATGTADLAMGTAAAHPGVHVTGVDFAAPMLDVGARKVRAAGMSDRVELVEGDALALPFADAAFDVTAVAFGMRNIPDRKRALREMARVTVPGGQVMVLEMSFAPAALFKPLYGVYLTWILPRLALLFAKNPATYWYLGDTIRRFPAPDAFSAIMTESGLEDVVAHRLTFGAACLHIGRTSSMDRAFTTGRPPGRA
jgi:demethylmenaquinone methyltransferase / 2-methoxy-6-polyprenyl-1,4-benzoquinol methylase